MTKTTKTLWIILVAILMVACVIAASGCSKKHEHPLTIRPEKRPTCVAEGNVVYWECETCEKYFADESGRKEVAFEDLIIPSFGGHNFSSGVCTRCGYRAQTPTSHLSFNEIKDDNNKVIAYAFAGIGAATEEVVVIPETYNNLPVTHIVDFALYNNDRITSITIPAKVVSIGQNVFDGCKKLENIHVDEYNEVFESVNGSLYTKGKEQMLRYPQGKTATSFTLPSEVQFIAAYAFKDAILLKNFYMSQQSKCQEIASYAFEGCINLQTARIASNVSQMGESIFYNCGSLQELTLPFVGARKFVNQTAQYPLGYLFGTVAYVGGKATPQTFYDNSSANTNTTTYYVPTSLEIVKVTGGTLCSGAFYNCDNVRTVEVDGVATINSNAFTSATALLEVYLSSSVTRVGQHAIVNCPAATIRCQVEARPNDWNLSWNIDGNAVVWNCDENNVDQDGNVHTVVDGLNYFLRTNGQVAVARQRQNLSGDVKIPVSVEFDGQRHSVTSIVPDAFNGCGELTSLTIPQGVDTVGRNAFANCISMVIYYERTTLPAYSGGSGWHPECNSSNCPIVLDCLNSDTTRDGSIYLMENGLRYVIKNGIATVTRQSLQITVANIPETILLKGVTYPVGAIAENAFANSALAKITIPISVTTIGENAFENCKNLTEIIIPQTVSNVSKAFIGCDALTIRCVATEKPDKYADGWNALSANSYCPVVWNCNENSVATDGYEYLTLNNVRYALKDGVARVARQPVSLIGEVMLLSTVSYKNTTYPVESIANEAFRNCTLLQKIAIPVSVRSLGVYAFSGCSSLTSITLQESITSLPMNCFAECTSLAIISIPASVTELDFNVFESCTKLRMVIFANGSKCTTIGSGAFANCYSLARITIPQSVTSIGKQAFLNCTSLTSVTFENTSGWQYSQYDNGVGTQVNSATLASPSQAAATLLEKSNYYWNRKEA